ncbi:hypothetical protein [Asanoa ishikariensis]|uniref:hypothetical protein n=1 Tax=Asanoa ishikariensis TaxID=137265 RepID=UPI00115F7F3C|nr:hypothetical protein [Asanoa ishikariensis]
MITPSFVAVIDGSTPKTSDRRQGLFSGEVIADVLAAAVQSLPENASADEAIQLLHETIRDERLRNSQAGSLPSDEIPAASMVILACQRREVWRIGDCAFGIDDQFHVRHAPHEEIAARTRAAYLRCLIAEGTSVDKLRENDLGRELVLPLLRKAAVFRNSADVNLGYGAFDGIVDPRARVDVFPVPPGCGRLTLVSDGYPNPSPSLEKSELALLARIQADPLMIGSPPHTKGVKPGNASFDDRSFIGIEVRG